MEYKKDKRTKNLTLRDIHVGDWVQVWSDITELYSPPLKVIQICDDGTIYLVTSDNERNTPFEENIKNVDALPITPELMKGFGFDVVTKEYEAYRYNILYDCQKICELCVHSNNCITLESQWEMYEYFHEFLDANYHECPEILNLVWKGIEKK